MREGGGGWTRGVRRPHAGRLPASSAATSARVPRHLPFGETPGRLMPTATLRADQRQRYARHLALAEIGAVGQQKLLRSRVLIVGVGALGSPAALYLAAAGVGTIGLADHDSVRLSNLQRQVIHSMDGLNRAKVEGASRTLLGINPDISVETIETTVDARN